MCDPLTQYEIAGQNNWRVTGSNEYGEEDGFLFHTLEDAKDFLRNHIVAGNSADNLDLAFIVPFSTHVTIEI